MGGNGLCRAKARWESLDSRSLPRPSLWWDVSLGFLCSLSLPVCRVGRPELSPFPDTGLVQAGILKAVWLLGACEMACESSESSRMG